MIVCWVGPVTDLDLVIDGDPEQAARMLARAAGPAACFALSEDFGAWRVVAHRGAWRADLEPLRGGSLQADLELRYFTVNAIAEPIAGGEPIDPLGGIDDLKARRLRMAGSRAFEDDPLRVLRLVRMVVELDLRPEPQTIRAARACTGRLSGVSVERVFIELRRIVAAAHARAGVELMGELGATAVALPSSTPCAASSRTAFIISTCMSTRSRCSTRQSRYRPIRPSRSVPSTSEHSAS